MNFRSIVNIGLILTFLSLSACGGSSSGGDTNYSTSHPEFFRSKATLQASYYPTGDISETMPTFSWRAIPNATEYHFGHETTADSSQWLNYYTSASDAGCPNTGDMCEHTPSDYTFPLNVEKAWWVQAKVNGAWQDWSRPIIFTVAGGGGGGVPTPIAPTGDIHTTTPEFSWSSVSGATDYMLGYEDMNTSEGWQVHEFSNSDANCQMAQTCVYTPSNPNFSVGQNIAWWVKAKVNGGWGDWSEAGSFTINQTQTKRPFILKVNPYSRRCGRGGCFSTPNIFTIHTKGSGYNYNIDCDSDGVLEATNMTADFSCPYSTKEIHTVTITGDFPHIYKLSAAGYLEIVQWGDQKWRSMEAAFQSAPKLIISAIDTPDLSNVKSMKDMFRDIRTSTNIYNIANWDVSNVTDMSYLFSGSNFNADISQWNVHKVQNMQGMFQRNRYFKQDINSWDVSNVTDMSHMFEGTIFDNPLNGWNVSKVANTAYMFSGAPFNQDINNWDVSNVINMKAMFQETRKFNQSLSNWNVGNVKDMSNMFASGAIYNHDLSQWDVSNVTDMGAMFAYHYNFNQDISNWDVSNVRDMGSIFLNNLAFNSNISNWNVSNVENMRFMFGHTAKFNQNISNWDVSNVTNMDGMFTYTQSFNQDISGWNVSKVTNMSSMFRDTGIFNQNITGWDVSKVTNMGSMFTNARAFNQDISSWDVSSVKDMYYMFSNSNLTTSYYNNMLVRWSTLNLQDNVRFGVGTTKYTSSAASSRNRLINDFGWTITDGGQL